MHPPSAEELWQGIFWAYLLTITLETPVLFFGLSPRHAWQRRLFCGVWLTACTYPIVWILFPLTAWQWWGYTAYIVIAEVFAPVAECLIFLAAYADKTTTWREIIRDCAAIVAANLLSYIGGGYLLELVR